MEVVEVLYGDDASIGGSRHTTDINRHGDQCFWITSGD
jgi:hypothetical protein